jgi:predicted metal-dependent hydrolase
VNGRPVPLVWVRHPRARRYVLRLGPDGAARVTIPRGGSQAGAWRFAERNRPWLERQLQRLAARPPVDRAWRTGTEILFRGETVLLDPAADAPGCIAVAGQRVRIEEPAGDLRPVVERHLRRLAAVEFPPRVMELAQRHGLVVGRVTVRDQKSRWGSCSRRRTISLNWRLIQAPPFVADYIILHELMHLRQMNHSEKFWREVEGVCPDFRAAERWLKAHGRLLRE